MIKRHQRMNARCLGRFRRNGGSSVHDDENQLIRVTITNATKSEFRYDGKMRRRERIEFVWAGNTWVTNLLVRYVYDGNLVVQERHYVPQPFGEILQTVVSYTRGNDLSGSLEGAGGIGGLLARTDHSTFNLQPSTAFYHADGNGNVTCLVDEQNAVVARYIYDPYGTITASQGSLADANLYRFSSKEFHPQSELVYYLYRYYEPNLQRWVNRDPLGEPGFEIVRLVGQTPLIRKLLFAINDPQIQIIMTKAFQDKKGISLEDFLYILQTIETSYAPKWPAELLANPNLFHFGGSNPINGFDEWGNKWYDPRTWKWAEPIIEAIQYIVPYSEFFSAARCIPDVIDIGNQQPAKRKFLEDEDAEVPPTAG